MGQRRRFVKRGASRAARTLARRALPRPLYIGSAACAFVAAAIRFTSIDWNARIFYNETNPAGNETGGLLIVGFWFAFLALRLGGGSARSAVSR